MIGLAQASDTDELTRLYRRNHPDIWGSLEPEVRHESQTFVARDGDGRIIGLALVSDNDYGVRSYGVIHELEVARDADLNTIGRSLVKACLRWLTERGTPEVYASPTNDRDCTFYRRVGFEECGTTMYAVVPVQAAHHTFA